MLVLVICSNICSYCSSCFECSDPSHCSFLLNSYILVTAIALVIYYMFGTFLGFLTGLFLKEDRILLCPRAGFTTPTCGTRTDRGAVPHSCIHQRPTLVAEMFVFCAISPKLSNSSVTIGRASCDDFRSVGIFRSICVSPHYLLNVTYQLLLYLCHPYSVFLCCCVVVWLRVFVCACVGREAV